VKRNVEGNLMRSENEQYRAAMPRLLLLTGAILLMADHAFAQNSPDPTPMQCQLIRWAVAQYGFAAARQHALETYGPQAVKTGDKCFTKQEGRDTSAYAPTKTEPPRGHSKPQRDQHAQAHFFRSTRTQ
jgi:hypothetical protein